MAKAGLEHKAEQKANGGGPPPPAPEAETDYEEAVELAGYGPFNWLLLSTGVLSALSHQGNSVLLSYLLPAAACDLELTALRKGVLTAIPYAGMLASALLWGFLADTLGRRKLLVRAYLLDAACSLCSSLAQTYWLLLLLRFCGGFIICGPMAIQKTFLTEYHDAAHRPRIMMWVGVFVAVANVSFPLLAWVLLPLPWAWQPAPGFVFNSWRAFVAVLALPSLAAAASLALFSESPKFLLSTGRTDRALALLRRMYAWNTRAHPDTFPVRRLRAEPRPAVLTAGGSVKRAPLRLLRLGWQQMRPLLRPPHRARALLVIAIQFCSLLGMNTLRLWVPQLFASVSEYRLWQAQSGNATGAEDVALCEMLAIARPGGGGPPLADADPGGPCSPALQESRVYVQAVTVGAATGAVYLLAIVSIRFTGKRALMVAGYVAGGGAGVALYWARADSAVLALSSAYVALMGLSHTVAIAVVMELFPTQLRAMAVSLTLMAGQLGTVLGNVLFPVLLALRCLAVFLLLGAVALSCAGLSLLLPKTKDLQQ